MERFVVSTLLLAQSRRR